MELFKQLPQEIETMIFRNVHELNFIKVKEQMKEIYFIWMPSNFSKHYIDDEYGVRQIRKKNRRYRYHWQDTLTEIMRQSIIQLGYRCMSGYKKKRVIRYDMDVPYSMRSQMRFQYRIKYSFREIRDDSDASDDSDDSDTE